MNYSLAVYFFFALTLFGGYWIELTWREFFAEIRIPELSARFARDDLWAHTVTAATVLLLSIGLYAWLKAGYVLPIGLPCFGLFGGASLADYVCLKHR